MQILRAKAEDAAKLTEIAFSAKRHWGYPEQWIENWRHVLTIQPEFYCQARDAHGFRGERADRLLFFGLRIGPDASGASVGAA